MVELPCQWHPVVELLCAFAALVDALLLVCCCCFFLVVNMVGVVVSKNVPAM